MSMRKCPNIDKTVPASYIIHIERDRGVAYEEEECYKFNQILYGK